ncbi:MATE family efflux transporter [Chryseobacterium pennipullorum]|uniref:Polysaccharide biosynthesis protein n=1 Tax=Chryseobacterium pennipullorum TaxID=2258963 RepID=A0A3D9B7D6_9FLAO|nr:MATE family efflux transporter [Chryseobacterium pennipullorum]REC49611.1 polysaccharide biosynthesis protein [Chryseobacterium pennipullorum]
MSDSKRIAKNTFFLYIRMIINMLISLYTSRVILNTLGVTDYGIYNLVGGVVVLFSFLNNAMTNATQRFLNYEIPSKIKERINRVFCMSINIHFVISIIVVILSETVGLWFLNYKLNIPDDRMYAANIVYQMSILTTLINIMRIPYNAMIITNEKMSFYAFLGIFETCMKLIIVFLLLFFKKYDLLILYGILLMLVNLLINIIYFVYCSKNFHEQTQLRYVKDKKLFKELISFSGWNLFGQVAVLSSTQGINMILNIFIGVTINAAMGIANQVNAAIYNFISNMQVAFTPQIVQSYAGGRHQQHKNLVLNSSKYSLYLFLILAIPFLIQTEFILHLWLGKNLPPYVISFTQVIILNSIVSAMVGSFWMSVNAIGNIRNYQIVISCILILSLPASYIILKNGLPPTYVLIANLCLNIITFLYRFWYINQKLVFKRSEILTYLKGIVFVLIYIIVLIYLFKNNSENNYFNIFFQIGVAELILIAIAIFTGVSKEEFLMIKGFVNNKLMKNFKGNK